MPEPLPADDPMWAFAPDPEHLRALGATRRTVLARRAALAVFVALANGAVLGAAVLTAVTP